MKKRLLLVSLGLLITFSLYAENGLPGWKINGMYAVLDGLAKGEYSFSSGSNTGTIMVVFGVGIDGGTNFQAFPNGERPAVSGFYADGDPYLITIKTEDGEFHYRNVVLGRRSADFFIEDDAIIRNALLKEELLLFKVEDKSEGATGVFYFTVKANKDSLKKILN